MISEKTVNEIIESARIEEVVSDFIGLKKRGANLLGLCPFHNEKTPSFTVSPAKNIFKCFGCGAAGNAVNFIMQHEHYSYPEALRYLAEKYRITIDETVQTDHQKEAQLQLESLFILNTFVQEYYTDLLHNNPEGKSIGLTYFKERGFSEKTIKKFQLGFSLNKQDALIKAAKSNGYSEESLQRSGLISNASGQPIDFFRDRVIFPIHNLSGKVVAFAGRLIGSNKKGPKYINSPETEIYHKSKILYGASLAKKSIREKDECLLVEGYTDVISLHQGGIENVVASSGTSLTIEQIRLIKRYTENITILYDGDKAGQNAASRGLELILEEGLNVKIALLPENEDPDSFMRKEGLTGFNDFIDKKAEDFIIFKVRFLTKDAKNDPAKKAGIIKEIVAIIAKIPDMIKRAVYVKECSNLLGINEQILNVEINKINRKGLEAKGSFSKAEANAYAEKEIIPGSVHKEQKEANTDDFQERDIIRVLLEHGNQLYETEITVGQFITGQINPDHIENPLYKQIYFECIAQVNNNGIIAAHSFINHKDPEIARHTMEMLMNPYDLSENWETKYEITTIGKEENFKNDVDSAMNRFNLKKVLKMIKENEQRIKEAEDDNEITELLKAHLYLNNLKKEFTNHTGTVYY